MSRIYLFATKVSYLFNSKTTALRENLLIERDFLKNNLLSMK